MIADRLLLTDDTWARLAAALTQLKSRRGAPPALSDRLFVEAILYIARAGHPWRDLPDYFGKWDAVYQRFRRWQKKGIWAKLCEQFRGDLGAVRTLLVDSTVI